MTAIVAIACPDGVVIGADSSSTFTTGSSNTIEQPTMKLHVVANRMIVAGTGHVGFGQRFNAIAETQWQAGAFKGKSAVDCAKELSRKGIDDFASTHGRLGLYAAMVAFPAQSKAHLCEFALADFQPELKSDIWYGSIGSGQHITDPFLGFLRDVFWNGARPNLHDAMFCVTWALDQAVSLNPGGIKDPIRLAVLELKGKDWNARLLEDAELALHRQHVQAAKEYLGKFTLELSPAAATGLPPVPEVATGAPVAGSLPIAVPPPPA